MMITIAYDDNIEGMNHRADSGVITTVMIDHLQYAKSIYADNDNLQYGMMDSMMFDYDNHP